MELVQCPSCKERVPPLNFCDRCGGPLFAGKTGEGKRPMQYVGDVCPHCQTPIRVLEKISVCAVCGTAHHRDCWKKAGKCSTLGCKGYPAIAGMAEEEGKQ